MIPLFIGASLSKPHTTELDREMSEAFISWFDMYVTHYCCNGSLVSAQCLWV